MRTRCISFVLCLVSAAVAMGAAPDHELKPAKALPEGLAKPVADVIADTGVAVSGAGGPVCELWLRKDLEVKAGFKPSLAVKYPFAPGQLIGVLAVHAGETFTDFRGQELKPDVYTLRYGQQPEDGNHIGTSELADFLLALPAAIDKDPKPISAPDPLHGDSAQSAGSAHPAIFALLPVEEKGAKDKAELSHDEDRELWIATLVGKTKDAKPVQVRLVVIGKAEG